jgi:Mn2+/Fe2+ NRAMP family transporter
MLYKKISNILGPGLLFASTAIGVSHLVQSTRAGANYGFALIGFIIAANLFKYPFFEYGSRYANATKESLIDGYKRLGRPVIWTYFIVTLCSMFFVMSAVGFVTVGFLDNFLNLSALWPSFKLFPTLLLYLICCGILLVGKFNLLDNLIKIIGVVLLSSTILAFVLTLIHGPAERIDNFIPPDIFDNAGILFIIALMGWMPTALDLCTWNSLWTIEKIKTSGYTPSLRETLFEFNTGYFIAAGLSICFLTMGAYFLYGTGTKMPESSGAFAGHVVTLYTNTIGDWSYLIISASAFSIMFSTSITVFDGYARALERTTEVLFLSEQGAREALTNSRSYNISLIVLGTGSFLIIALFLKQFKVLIDLATTISFLIAPFIAVVNLILVQEKYVGKDAVPPLWMRVLSYAGIVFLTGFALFFLYTKVIT